MPPYVNYLVGSLVAAMSVRHVVGCRGKRSTNPVCFEMTVDLYVTTQRRFRLEVHADEQPGSLPANVTARIERAFQDG